ncbi:metallophosphoesterase family protein [Noviherbaspirillum sp.]|uniref:metallophosphoesterase family protein n=1 Tax=Noviherbaspirillum sp. TaxID=1926288 RepID=UPI002B47E087|nr:metallophosphoesterase [Noviherbaspirillum sp.]HJV83731.1 metallophosphoesterase [Noviherbaspirillum sp.]
MLQETIRLAAVGDLHCTQTSTSELRSFFLQAADNADILLLCGDLTDYGLPEEAHVLAEALSPARIPVVAVLGNHDFESGKENEVRRILTGAGVHMLDGEACEIHGIGIAGVKGFAGGYGRRSLGPWGESAIKHFVNEAIQETLKFESALAKLRTSQRIGLLHYSPIQATVEGEPPEIFAFLGTSRLEEPLIRYPVNAVFHGHAHRGQPEGKTANNIPVYNVAKPLLERTFPGRPPFRIVEIPKSETVAM